jgi:hypothetical protein
MIRQRLIFFIGLWVALLPFLGFPKNFRTVLFVLTGFGLIAISYFMYIQTKAIKEERGGSETAEQLSKTFRKARKKKAKKESDFSSTETDSSENIAASDTYSGDQYVSSPETPIDLSQYENSITQENPEAR